MSFYLTGNPVPSASMPDVHDNAQNLDFALNEITSTFWTDRLGRRRMSWLGIESAFTMKLTDFESRFDFRLAEQESVFAESLVDKENRFQQFLGDSGYVFLGDYEDGPFQFSARNQYIRFQNQFYRLNKSTDTGFTTTGTDETSFANDVTHLVLMDGDTLRQNLGSNEEGMGLSLLGATGSGTLYDLLGEWTSPEAWGAVANDETEAHQNSLSFFYMFEYLRARGGGVVQCKPRSEYYLDFVNFIPGNVTLNGNGAKLIFINPISGYGRGGLVIGSSREFNYESAKNAYTSGNYPASIVNTSFVDPSQKQYIRDNQQYVQADTVSINNLIIEAKFTSTTGWGGFAINCVNAQNINISDYTAIGWTEAVNVGSDVPPNTPSCHNVKIQNLTVVRGDLVRTYYAGFFFANSTNCEISGAVLETPLTAGTGNGSFGALNFTEDCVIRGISVPSLGRTASSEGILVNNSKGCLVENIRMGNAKSAVSTFYVDATMNDPERPNIFDGITGISCDQVLGVTGKYAIFSNIKAYNCIQEILFRNDNATGNKFKSTPDSITTGSSGSNLKYWFLINNAIKGWRRVYTWLRPLDLLASPFSLLSSWNDNNSVKFNTGTTVYFMYKIPVDVKAVSGFTVYGDFSVGAAAAAVDSVCTVEIISMSAVDGNGTNPVVLLSAQVSAREHGDGIWMLSDNVQATEPGYLALEGSANGVDNTMYLRITYKNGVADNTLKETGIRLYKE